MTDYLPILALFPLAIILGLRFVAVARRKYWVEYVSRKRGHWHVYEPKQDGPAKLVARAMLVKEFLRRDLV